MTLVTEAGTKRRSGSRENNVWPLERSTRRATGISGGTGAGSSEGRTVATFWASSGLAGVASKTSAPSPARAVEIVFKRAPIAGGAAPTLSRWLRFVHRYNPRPGPWRARLRPLHGSRKDQSERGNNGPPEQLRRGARERRAARVPTLRTQRPERRRPGCWPRSAHEARAPEWLPAAKPLMLAPEARPTSGPLPLAWRLQRRRVAELQIGRAHV